MISSQLVISKSTKFPIIRPIELIFALHDAINWWFNLPSSIKESITDWPFQALMLLLQNPSWSCHR